MGRSVYAVWEGLVTVPKAPIYLTRERVGTSSLSNPGPVAPSIITTPFVGSQQRDSSSKQAGRLGTFPEKRQSSRRSQTKREPHPQATLHGASGRHQYPG